MKEKTLKIIIYIAGVVCFYTFIAVRVQPLYNAILLEKIIPEYWENTKYGELYYYNNFITHFREEGLPPHTEKYRLSDRHPELEEADILLFGDSFFDFTRMETFPEQLTKKTGLKAYYAREDFPLEYLEKADYENNKEKILLYESAERYLYYRFMNPHPEYNPNAKSKLAKAYDDLINVIFVDEAEVKFKNLVSRSYFTTHIYSLISTLKFDMLGYITSLTPKYALQEDKPWLFYYDQVNEEAGSFYYEHSDEEIQNYCDNIMDLSERLYEKYKLKMVFMMIPSKYTIYHTLINDDKYNDFIPKIYAELEKRGMPLISVYDEYIKLRDDTDLYYGTDTHWTPKGLDIALDQTLKVINNVNINNNNYESSTLSWRFRNENQ